MKHKPRNFGGRKAEQQKFTLPYKQRKGPKKNDEKDGKFFYFI